jgi:hypothetical protein
MLQSQSHRLRCANLGVVVVDDSLQGVKDQLRYIVYVGPHTSGRVDDLYIQPLAAERWSLNLASRLFLNAFDVPRRGTVRLMRPWLPFDQQGGVSEPAKGD